MSKVQLAESITVVTQDDDVFIELRMGGRVFAVAGLTLEAATDFSESVTGACAEALEVRNAAKASVRSGVLH